VLPFRLLDAETVPNNVPDCWTQRASRERWYKGTSVKPTINILPLAGKVRNIFVKKLYLLNQWAGISLKLRANYYRLVSVRRPPPPLQNPRSKLQNKTKHALTVYKAAFTIDATVNTGTVDIDGRANSIKGIERERSNISYDLSPEDQQRVAYQEALQQRDERARVQRLQTYDQTSEDNYHKIHKLLLQ